MKRMLHGPVLGAVAILALTPSAALANHGQDQGQDPGRHHGRDVLRADLTPAVPTDDPINGVKPGGLPWVIQRGEVRVRADGRTDVRIDGLQVPRNGSADNPVPMVDAVLYCGGVQVADSGPQPLSVPGGDARFRVWLGPRAGCTDATVLISPSTAVGAAYIASAVG